MWPISVSLEAEEKIKKRDSAECMADTKIIRRHGLFMQPCIAASATCAFSLLRATKGSLGHANPRLLPRVTRLMLYESSGPSQ
jgi:hypothetical protein